MKKENMKNTACTVALFLFISSIVLISQAKAVDSVMTEGPEVIFISPGPSDDIFFSRMETFMKAAAEDLGIKLEVLYCQRNYVTTFNVINRLKKRKHLPHYLVLINENGMGRMILPWASDSGIKVILINEGIPDSERSFFGHPGTRFENWFCEFIPDDLEAGRLLADELISARVKQGDRDIRLAGLCGTAKTTSSDLRTRGLYQAAAAYPEVHILQVVPAFWDIERAATVTKGLLSRYPSLDIVWAASDGMGYGAARTLKQEGKSPGSDILTGGIDWTDFSFDMVKKGFFTATVGGHFMDGGWALVMIFDHFHGYSGPFPARSHFSVINRENIDRFACFFRTNAWNRIDFRCFSKTLNPTLDSYDFSLRAVLGQLHQEGCKDAR